MIAHPEPTARDREARLLERLAAIAHGLRMPTPEEPEEDLRQLGYAASVARGRTGDAEADCNLTRAAEICREILADRPNPPVPAHANPVQRRWRASRVLDAGKLRSELPAALERHRRFGTGSDRLFPHPKTLQAPDRQ